MDPKSLSHLDPKMQETYARVMGTTTSSQDQTTQGQDDPQLSATPDGQNPSTEQVASEYNPPMQNEANQNSPFFSDPNQEQDTKPSEAEAIENNLNNPVEPDTSSTNDFVPGAPVTPYDQSEEQKPDVSNFTQTPLTSPSDIQNGPKETSALLKVLYIIAAAVFFLIYTVFWIKIFNLPFIF